MAALSDQDRRDRITLQKLFAKRAANTTTKEAFLIYEDQTHAVAETGTETYVILSQDRAVGWPLFLHGALDIDKLVKASALLDNAGVERDTLYDIGANIGSICLPALTRGLFRRAVAFEPDPKLVRLLRANAILNGVEGQLEVNAFGLGAASKSVDLMASGENTGDNRIVGKRFDDDTMGEASRPTVSIEIRALDAVASSLDPKRSLLWMDVQGYEGFVLEGAAKALAGRPPLVAEFWPYGMRRLDSFDRFKHEIAQGGYTRFADLQDDNPALRPLAPDALDQRYTSLGETNPNACADFIFL